MNKMVCFCGFLDLKENKETELIPVSVDAWNSSLHHDNRWKLLQDNDVIRRQCIFTER